MKRGFAFGAVLLSACAALPSGANRPAPGEWGGQHVGLSLTAEGGTLEYDCAAGTMNPPVANPDGTFTAEGTHTPGLGGPETAGQVLPTYGVRYDGRVRGDTMTLRGTVETGVTLGPFTLRRGAQPIIFRCL